MVSLFPPLNIKPFQLCADGELIQHPWGGNALGIATSDKQSGKRFSILLTGDAQPLPCFIPIENVTSKVLSFGTDYDIELDDKGPTDFGGRKLSELNGGIFVAENRWVISVLPAKGMGMYAAAAFDLKDGILTNTPSSDFMIFGKWQIHINRASPLPRMTLYEFPITPKN